MGMILSNFILLDITPLDRCELINSFNHKGQNLIVFHGPNYDKLNTADEHLRRVKADTLIYKFNSFIEFNEKPSIYAIESITVDAGYCFGLCPIFRVQVNTKGQVRFEQINLGSAAVKRTWQHSENLYKIKGKFVSKTLLSDTETTELWNLIDYLNIEKLRDKYEVPWSDSPTGTIRIKFTDGKEKIIFDYGEKGTFGLELLFSKIYALAKANKIY